MIDRLPPLSFPDAFERTLRLSPFASRLAAVAPGSRRRLPLGRRRARSPGPTSRAALAAVPSGDEAALARELRRLRARTMLTLVHRDLAGQASLEEVVRTVSDLAEVGVACAADHAQRSLAITHGSPAGGERLLVVGMGKLGGRELNVSSDVDLVFLHESRWRDGRAARDLAPRVLHAGGPASSSACWPT